MYVILSVREGVYLTCAKISYIITCPTPSMLIMNTAVPYSDKNEICLYIITTLL